MHFLDVVKNPALYPHPVSHIEIIETHISWVVLTGEFAYKFKKPVDFGFLDFTTLAARRFFCEEELRLNQRLAANIYLEVIALNEQQGNYAFTPIANDFTIEFAVKMRQFDNRQQLNKQLAAHQINLAKFDSLARDLALFHSKQPVAPQNADWGSSENIWNIVSDNFERPLQILTDEGDRAALRKLYAQAKHYFQQLTPLFKQRKTDGFIRECHGDLHLANIAQIDDQYVPFDCLEFNTNFRWIDTLYDLAFLLMDLEASNQAPLANRCLNQYLAVNGDYAGLAILNFYKACRATVRAKVALIGKELDYAQYQHYFKLANGYTQQQHPHLYLAQGLSGSGKSYLSQYLSQEMGLIWLRADTERKRLHQQWQSLPCPALYSQEMNKVNAQHLLTQSNLLIRSGFSVIVDATFIRQDTRKEYIKLAQALNIPLRILICKCSMQTRKQRLLQRKRQGIDPSDADISIMEQQIKSQQSLSPPEQQLSYIVDTEQPGYLESTLKALLLSQQNHLASREKSTLQRTPT